MSCIKIEFGAAQKYFIDTWIIIVVVKIIHVWSLPVKLRDWIQLLKLRINQNFIGFIFSNLSLDIFVVFFALIFFESVLLLILWWLRVSASSALLRVQGLENSLCVMRNLSYQLYTELPPSVRLRLEGPRRATAVRDSEAIGCFTLYSKKDTEVRSI